MGLNRAQFFAKTENGILTGVERLTKYANDYQNTQTSNQSSLFGGSVASYIPEPSMPEADEWPLIEKLKYEKEVIGIYLTGHPLDNYRVEMERFCNTDISDLKNMQKARSGEGGEEIMNAFAELRRRGEIRIGGLVSNVQHKIDSAGLQAHNELSIESRSRPGSGRAEEIRRHAPSPRPPGDLRGSGDFVFVRKALKTNKTRKYKFQNISPGLSPAPERRPLGTSRRRSRTAIGGRAPPPKPAAASARTAPRRRRGPG